MSEATTIATDFALMKEALAEANEAAREGEVPIGAVLAVNGAIIARDHNRIEQSSDPTAHAEMLVIKKAAQFGANWRLSGATLYVTLEPCIMCMGAIRFSRIGRLVFGAGDSRFGACGTVMDLSVEPKLGPLPEVVRGVMQEECRMLLKDFFAARR